METQCTAVKDREPSHPYQINSSLNPIQFRFPATVNQRQTYGVTVILYDERTRRVLVVPYNLKLSHKKKERRDVLETIDQVIDRCKEKEIGGQVRLGRQLELGHVVADNSDEDSLQEGFTKHVVLVEYKGGKLLSQKEISEGEKNGAPIWVCINRMRKIFEEMVLVEESFRCHPQKYAYNMFCDFLKRN